MPLQRSLSVPPWESSEKPVFLRQQLKAYSSEAGPTSVPSSRPLYAVPSSPDFSTRSVLERLKAKSSDRSWGYRSQVLGKGLAAAEGPDSEYHNIMACVHARGDPSTRLANTTARPSEGFDQFHLEPFGLKPNMENVKKSYRKLNLRRGTF